MGGITQQLQPFTQSGAGANPMVRGHEKEKIVTKRDRACGEACFSGEKRREVSWSYELELENGAARGQESVFTRNARNSPYGLLSKSSISFPQRDARKPLNNDGAWNPDRV